MIAWSTFNQLEDVGITAQLTTWNLHWSLTQTLELVDVVNIKALILLIILCSTHSLRISNP